MGAQPQSTKAENYTKLLLAPSPETYLPFGVLQEQICFGLLGEGLWRKWRHFRHMTLVCAWLKQRLLTSRLTRNLDPELLLALGPHIQEPALLQR